eukprot:IDg19215t1
MLHLTDILLSLNIYRAKIYVGIADSNQLCALIFHEFELFRKVGTLADHDRSIFAFKFDIYNQSINWRTISKTNSEYDMEFLNKVVKFILKALSEQASAKLTNLDRRFLSIDIFILKR